MEALSISLPQNFIQKISSVFEDGAEWLARLPDILAETANRWQLTLLPHFPNLSYNYVAPVLCADGTEAVLKAGVPRRDFGLEVDALRLYNGNNCVRLLNADKEQGVMLLERLFPGETLTPLADDAHDEKATSIAAAVMRGLWCPVPPDHPFPTTQDWMQGLQEIRAYYNGGTGPFPAMLVEEAETLNAELHASASEPILLHGDLHHDNILSAGRQPWLAIDPQGVVGEPAYEVGALLRNLWPDRHTHANPGRLLARRIDQLAEELEIDRARVRGWAVSQAALSAWWCIEGNDDCFEAGLADAELLASIKV